MADLQIYLKSSLWVNLYERPAALRNPPRNCKPCGPQNGKCFDGAFAGTDFAAHQCIKTKALRAWLVLFSLFSRHCSTHIYFICLKLESLQLHAASREVRFKVIKLPKTR